MSRVTESRNKRTNSLAFATVDCHTCLVRGNKCDRGRPQCLACLSKGIKCAGFATPLSWDQRRMWVADGKQAIDTSMSGSTVTKPSATKAAATKAARKFRFVETSANKAQKSSNQQTAPAAIEATVTSRSNDAALTTTTRNEVTPLLRPNFGRPYPMIEEVAVSNSDHALDQELSSALQAPLSASSQEVSSGSTISIEPEQPGENPQPLDFTLMLPDSPFPQVSAVPPADSHQVTAVDEVNFLDMDEMDVGDVGTDYQQMSALDLQQQNIWSPLLDFSRTPSPLRLPALPQLPPEPAQWAPSVNSHEELLNIYDSELCVLPLTSDANINPFRCHKETSRGSRLLFHSILALCYQHLHYQTKAWSDEVQQHKAQANNELTMALSKISPTNSDLSLLDSILVMFTLDCTLSAAGSWTTHLRRARTVIDSCGGAQALSNARLRSQAGMLLWWDACLALISRKGLVFDSSYIDYLFEHEENDPWSFYDLTVCPAEMIRFVVDLAELAREFEIASTMKWVSFDLTPVLAIEERLEDWMPNKRPKSFASPRASASPQNTSTAGEGRNSVRFIENVTESMEEESEEQLNCAVDQRHCIEAWRQALLIYIRRVFKMRKNPSATLERKQDNRASEKWTKRQSQGQLWCGSSHSNSRNDRHPTPSPHAQPKTCKMSLFALVRSTTNDIRCVRRSSQTQKQLLLPAFIAGSETSDPELRRFICAYCDWWSNKSRYKMFDTVHKLLLQIWEEMDRPTTSATSAEAHDQQPQGSDAASLPSHKAAEQSKDIKASCWWGSIIDQNAQMLSPEGTPIQYLFG